jgi:RNA polymerase sigma factor (sigma-70 family)
MSQETLPMLHQLRRLASRQAEALPDALLLERFVSHRDEEAFEVLLWRHGGMVLSLCRRLLRSEQDVEDAFQAVFLALVRKAASIVRRESLAGWLYRVAYRVALEARGNVARQPAGKPGCEPSVAPSDELIWRDLAPVLDEELHRLPEKHRLAVVLCYLEGRTVDEAARALGCPRGTVGTWLARARERLREQLQQRGVTLTSVVMAAVLAQQAGAAHLPIALVTQTGRVAGLLMAGQAAAMAAPVAALLEGVLRAMFLGKVKIVAAAAAVVFVVGLGLCGLWLQDSARAAPPRPVPGIYAEAAPWDHPAVPGNDLHHLLGDQAQCMRCHESLHSTNPHPALLDGPLSLKGWGVAIDPGGNSRFAVEKGTLAVTVQAGDHQLAAERGQMNAPRLLQDVEGDFIAQVRVLSRAPRGAKTLVEQRQPTQSAGLLLWQDSRNYARLEKAGVQPEGGDWRRFAGFELRKDGKAEREGDVLAVDGDSTWLRLERHGGKVIGAISADGVRWTSFEPMALKLPQRCFVGVSAGQNTTTPFEATFSDFEVYRKVVR